MKKAPPKKRGEAQVPMCSLCETRHWLRDPHNWPAPPKKKKRKK